MHPKTPIECRLRWPMQPDACSMHARCDFLPGRRWTSGPGMHAPPGMCERARVPPHDHGAGSTRVRCRSTLSLPTVWSGQPFTAGCSVGRCAVGARRHFRPRCPRAAHPNSSVLDGLFTLQRGARRQRLEGPLTAASRCWLRDACNAQCPFRPFTTHGKRHWLAAVRSHCCARSAAGRAMQTRRRPLNHRADRAYGSFVLAARASSIGNRVAHDAPIWGAPGARDG